MAANAASARIWPMVGSSAAFLNGCPPCGRARFRLDMAAHLSRYVQRSRITPSQGGPPQKGIPCGASARQSRSIWTKVTLSCCNCLSVRHLVYERVPSDFRRPTRSASAHRHVVALSYTLSRDTTQSSNSTRCSRCIFMNSSRASWACSRESRTKAIKSLMVCALLAVIWSMAPWKRLLPYRYHTGGYGTNGAHVDMPKTPEADTMFFSSNRAPPLVPTYCRRRGPPLRLLADRKIEQHTHHGQQQHDQVPQHASRQGDPSVYENGPRGRRARASSSSASWISLTASGAR